jgi:hypothetical protein
MQKLLFVCSCFVRSLLLHFARVCAAVAAGSSRQQQQPGCVRARPALPLSEHFVHV